MTLNIKELNETNFARLSPKNRELIKERLVKGEAVIEVAEIHPGIYWQTIAVGLLALLFFFIAVNLGLLLLFVTLCMAGYVTLKKSILLLVLTNKRMMFRYGVLQVDVVDMHFAKTESIELERMPTAYLMGYSRLVVLGTGTRLVSIPYVANGPQLKKAYNQIVLADQA